MMNELKTTRQKLHGVHQALTLQARPTANGEFEILAISAGVGNGWQFPAGALQASLPLWDGAECYLDHAAGVGGRSVRDLAGVLVSPAWDAARQGITARLRAIGPGGPLLTELGRQMLAEGDGPRPQVGFSADLLFTAGGKQVTEILRVFSVDLVMDPARGGAFIRSLNSQQEDCMSDVNEVQPNEPTPANAAAELEKARQLRLQMCGQLLETSLLAARLPAPAAALVRRQFSGKLFDPAELQKAVDEARGLVSELTGGLVISGPGAVQGMFDTRDRLQAAVDDLFGAPREKNAASLQVARLSGVRELYLTLTGDDELHGGYYPERARLATTADFSGLVKNALNKVVAATWEELGRAGYDWWQKVARVESFRSLHDITGTLVGTVGALPEVAEGAAYTELSIGDSPETASFKKYGGYIPLTLELIDRDETRKLRAYPRELAAAGLRKISSLVAAVFTDNSGVGPTLADGGALFNATAVTTAGGHKNLLTGALSASAWDAACTAVYNQPLLVKNETGLYGSGPKMAINPRYLLVPRALQLSAMKILYPTLENAASIYSENQQRGQPGDVVTVPEWSDSSDWAAVCDPRLAPAVYIGERFGLMPEIFIAGGELSPAVFTNDEHRLKVRHYLAVWVNDFRPLHKSNVTG